MGVKRYGVASVLSTSECGKYMTVKARFFSFGSGRDQVGAVLDGIAEVRRRQRVVHQQRHLPFRVQGLGFEVRCSGCWAWGLEFEVCCLRCEGLGVGFWDSGFGARGSRFGVWGLEFGVCGLRFNVQFAGCRVQGLGFGA